MLVGHVAAVRCVQYDGRLVFSGAYDYMVKVHRIELLILSLSAMALNILAYI